MIENINQYSRKVSTGQYYPVVIIPKAIRSILEKYPEYYRPASQIQKPCAPQKPIFPNVCFTYKDYADWLNSLSEEKAIIYKQYADVRKDKIFYEHKEKKVKWKDSRYYSLFILSSFLFLLGVPTTYIAAYDEDPNGFWRMFVVLLLFCGISMALIYKEINERNNLEYEQNIYYYKNALYTYVDDLITYVKRFNSYETAYKEYLKSLDEYNEDIRSKKKNPKVYSIRQRAYQLVNRTLKICELTYDEINTVKKGWAENFFYVEMLNYDKGFPFDIYVNVKVESTQDRGVVYYPDFLLCSNDGYVKKIYYDIEIDEPYAQSTGEPIHAVGMDSSRDNFFWNNDVIVIRFAESQIFKDSNRCIRFIKELHECLIGMNEFHMQMGINRCYNFKVERWSMELAMEWSKIHYRETYIPQILFCDRDNILYNNDRLALIKASQLDKKSISEISEIKTVKWYSRNCVLINMKSREQRQIDISPLCLRHFEKEEEVSPYMLWIETYINQNSEKIYFVGYYHSSAESISESITECSFQGNDDTIRYK